MRSRFHFSLKNGDTATLDAATNQLIIGQPGSEMHSVTLAYAESRLLQLLLQEPGEIKSRNEIMEFAWDNRVVAAGSLNQAIFTLRNLINDGRDHELLQTVPRRGYRFNASYVLDELGGASSPAAAQAPVDEAVAPGHVETRPVKPQSPPASPGTRMTFPWRTLLIPAYVVMFGLLALVFSYRGGLFDGRVADQVIETTQNGRVTYHFIGLDGTEIARNREEFKAVLETRDEHLAGEVWINRSNRLYDLSCIRPDGRTGNLLFSLDNRMANLKLEMVRKCLGDEQ